MWATLNTCAGPTTADVAAGGGAVITVSSVEAGRVRLTIDPGQAALPSTASSVLDEIAPSAMYYRISSLEKQIAVGVTVLPVVTTRNDGWAVRRTKSRFSSSS